MNHIWIDLAIAFFSFSIGIILGCLIMMRGDEPEDSNWTEEYEKKDKSDSESNKL